MTSDRIWSVHLAATAEADHRDILIWTYDRFGVVQARIYEGILNAALASLSRGPAIAGVRSATELPGGFLKLHVRQRGGKGRHVIVFRVRGNDDTIEVLRILHDSMDVARHLP